MKDMIRKWLVREVLGTEDEEMLQSLYDSYLATLDGEIAKARTQTSDGEFAALDRTAHTLKGVTLAVGDTETYDAVIKLRDAAKASDAAAASSAVAALESLRAAL